MNLIKTKFILLCLFYPLATSAQEIKENIDNYIRNYQYQQAIEYIEQQNDSSKEVLMQKYFCYDQLNNYSKAIETLSALTQRFPDDIHLKTQLALCYKNASRLDKSMEQLDELLQIDSTNTYFMIQKADLLNKCDSLDRAKQYYLRAWTLHPNDFDTVIKLSKIDINQNHYLSAMENLETILRRDSTHLQANLLTAYCYLLSDQYDESIQQFNKCQALGDSSLFLLKNLGFAYYYSPDYENNILYLSRAFEKDTTNNNVLYALATASKEANHYDEAASMYSKLVERMLQSKKLLYVYHKKLAETYREGGKYLDAINQFKEALHLADSSQNIELLFNISDTYDVSLKDYKSSLNYYRQYRKSLIDYRQNLLEKDSSLIHDIQNKIERLDKHLEYIEYQIKNKK
jgi:tetratricopeptide (TPR) repeat protein